jgi:hypothetical protein
VDARVSNRRNIGKADVNATTDRPASVSSASYMKSARGEALSAGFHAFYRYRSHATGQIVSTARTIAIIQEAL